LSEKNRRNLILLLWLALPLLVGCYAALCPRLPAEIAVQFDTSGAVTNSSRAHFHHHHLSVDLKLNL
jgi:hypothetical protein